MWMPPSTLVPRDSTTTIPITKSNAVTITTWVTLVVMVVVVLARQAVRWPAVRRLALDDVFILSALVFGVALSATSYILASDGLGSTSELTVRRANNIMKAYYASNFFYILSLGFAKLSLISFFYGDRTQPTFNRWILGFGTFVLAWTAISVIAVAFQCGLPRPWEVLTLHCYNRGVFWIVYCIIDMTTDVSIIMLAVNLVAYSKSKLSRKAAVVACFAPRIFVIGASLARLVYLYPITPHGNPSFELWVPVVCTQAQVCVAMITAAIPFMRLFSVGKETSVWKAEKLKRRNAVRGRDSTGCCSYICLKGHKRDGSSSFGSTATIAKSARTPDVSPRLPTPPRLSPMTPPRLRTPNNSGPPSRTPSGRGLRLQIPPPAIQVRPASHVDVTSPQTASSHVLSPECLSPQPLLSPPQAYSPTSPQTRGPSPPPPSHVPAPRSTSSNSPRSPNGGGNPNAGTTPPRFSLFPQTRPPRYSRLPQQHPNASLSVGVLSERSRSASRPPAQHASPHPASETRSPSPDPLIPVSPPTHSTPRFSRVLRDDPLRTHDTPAITSTAPVLAPLHTNAATAQSYPYPYPSPPAHSQPPSQASSTVPSYYVTTPPTAHTSDPSSLQTLPSYYTHSRTHTPPTPHPPAFALPVPPPPPPPAPVSVPVAAPSSPHRQRNRRVLTPQNASPRPYQMSPVSPVSPPTPVGFWGEGVDAGRQRHEARVVEVVRVRDVRSSPRIVRFA